MTTYKKKLNHFVNKKIISFIQFNKDLLSLKKNIGIMELSNQKIEDNILQSLANILSTNKTLTKLCLFGNSFTDTGALALANALTKNKTLKVLNLANNGITNLSMNRFNHAISNNYSLNSLDLSQNHIGKKGAKLLCSALHFNKVLTTLNLLNNEVGKTEKLIQSQLEKKIDYLDRQYKQEVDKWDALEERKEKLSLNKRIMQIGEFQQPERYEYVRIEDDLEELNSRLMNKDELKIQRICNELDAAKESLDSIQNIDTETYMLIDKLIEKNQKNKCIDIMIVQIICASRILKSPTVFAQLILSFLTDTIDFNIHGTVNIELSHKDLHSPKSLNSYLTHVFTNEFKPSKELLIQVNREWFYKKDAKRILNKSNHQSYVVAQNSECCCNIM